MFCYVLLQTVVDGSVYGEVAVTLSPTCERGLVCLTAQQVEWPAEKMSWADFRGKLLGPTDPASAPEGSLRQMIYSKWSELGL